MLGIKPGSSGRPASALNNWAIPPASEFRFFQQSFYLLVFFQCVRYLGRVSHTLGHITFSNKCINSGDISPLVANDKIFKKINRMMMRFKFVLKWQGTDRIEVMSEHMTVINREIDSSKQKNLGTVTKTETHCILYCPKCYLSCIFSQEVLQVAKIRYIPNAIQEPSQSLPMNDMTALIHLLLFYGGLKNAYLFFKSKCLR